MHILFIIFKEYGEFYFNEIIVWKWLSQIQPLHKYACLSCLVQVYFIYTCKTILDMNWQM